jgi:hypothetical protein
LGGFNIGILSAFIATGQQNDDLIAASREIHPITGAIVDAHLRYAFANGLNVTRIAGSQTFDPGQNACASTSIAKIVQPSGINIGFLYINHTLSVAYRLHLSMGCQALVHSGKRKGWY